MNGPFSAIAVDRSTIRYESNQQDYRKLRDQVKQIASDRQRLVYCGVHVLLEREGIEVKLKKDQRIYSQTKLRVKRRGGQKRALSAQRLMEVTTVVNKCVGAWILLVMRSPTDIGSVFPNY